MTTRHTSQLLVLLAALCGVLAFVCACKSKPDNFPNGPSMEAWMDERGIKRSADTPVRIEEPERTRVSALPSESEFPKLSEP